MDKKPIHKAVIDVAEDFMLQYNKIDIAIPFLCGAPGCGKTEMVRQLCNENGWGLVDPIHFAIKPIEKLSGIPKYKKRPTGKYGTLWTIPETIDRIIDLTEALENDPNKKPNALSPPPVVLFLDDLHLVDDSRFGYLFELFTERRFGDEVLPENTVLVCAGNHADNKAGARLENSAIMNRLNIMPIYPDFDFWKLNYAIKTELHSSVISFLSNDRYRQYFLEEELIDKAWGSPRSWARAARKLGFKENFYKKKPSIEDVIYLFNGTVGKTASTSFATYYKMYQKYNAKELLEDSNNFVLDNRQPLEKYIIINVLVDYIFTINKGLNVVIEKLSDIIYVYAKEDPELASVFVEEIINYEKAKNKKVLSMVIAQINKRDASVISIFEDLLIDVTTTR
jgi:MoxR-like ATPase